MSSLSHSARVAIRAREKGVGRRFHAFFTLDGFSSFSRMFRLAFAGLIACATFGLASTYVAAQSPGQGAGAAPRLGISGPVAPAARPAMPAARGAAVAPRRSGAHARPGMRHRGPSAYRGSQMHRPGVRGKVRPGPRGHARRFGKFSSTPILVDPPLRERKDVRIDVRERFEYRYAEPRFAPPQRCVAPKIIQVGPIDPQPGPGPRLTYGRENPCGPPQVERRRSAEGTSHRRPR